jgi:hypothetical protein
VDAEVGMYFELPDTRDPSCYNDHAFEVPADGNGINNEYAHVEITWATPDRLGPRDLPRFKRGRKL